MDPAEAGHWEMVMEFDFDNPMSGFSFSVRLASENYWTEDFTRRAIIEYRKFMFLAATSSEMVSPSEVVDIVWHQHLVFTQSYQAFGEVLGKQIQHVPSTHQHGDATRFRDAKIRTSELYEATFGQQPAVIWKYNGMFESLELPKASLKLRTFIIVGLIAAGLLIIPFYILLRPLFTRLPNPDFMYAYLAIVVLCFGIMEMTNRSYLNRTMSSFRKDSFIYWLTPFELVYLQSERVNASVISVVNELFQADILYVDADRMISLQPGHEPSGLQQWQVFEVMARLNTVSYERLLTELISKPIFTNSASAVVAFRKYFNKSKRFAKIFYLNFSMTVLLLLLGITRLATGLSRDKPVAYLVVALVVITFAACWFHLRLSRQMNFYTIPKFYRSDIVPNSILQTDWTWNYFLLGDLALAGPLLPHARNNSGASGSDSSGGGCGSSGDSSGSCSSSCGSSGCGGCGGGD